MICYIQTAAFAEQATAWEAMTSDLWIADTLQLGHLVRANVYSPSTLILSLFKGVFIFFILVKVCCDESKTAL